MSGRPRGMRAVALHGLVLGLVLGLAAGCGGKSGPTPQQRLEAGDAELAAIALPAGWTQRRSENGSGADPADDIWERYYLVPAGTAEAIRQLDDAVRSAGWQPGTGCSTGAACFTKERYRLEAATDTAAGCPGATTECAQVHLTMVPASDG